MSSLKKLINEVHRRSLWQVLGIYVVGAWIGYEVIQGLTEGMGLPTWFPSLAVVLEVAPRWTIAATAPPSLSRNPASASGMISSSRSRLAILRHLSPLPK